MTYQVNSLPCGWVLCPPLVATWIKQLRLPGQKRGTAIVFSLSDVVDFFKKNHVQHVADFLCQSLPPDQKELSFPEEGCAVV